MAQGFFERHFVSVAFRILRTRKRLGLPQHSGAFVFIDGLFLFLFSSIFLRAPELFSTKMPKRD